METLNQSIIIQKFNEYDREIDALIHVNTIKPIVDQANLYQLQIHKAEIPINNIPLDVITKGYKLAIFNKNPGHPTLIEGFNYFEVTGAYYSVDEFLTKLNTLINPAPYSLGSFGLNAEDFIEFKHSEAADRVDVDLYFSSRLTKLIPFDTLYSQTDTINYENVIYHAVKQDQTTPIITQRTYSLNNFYKFKQLRLMSTLPTRSFFVIGDNKGTMDESQILIDISMNSENFNQNMKTWTLIPNAFRNFELVTPNPIHNFLVWAEVFYTNNTTHRLLMSPESYMSVTLAFNRILEPIV